MPLSCKVMSTRVGRLQGKELILKDPALGGEKKLVVFGLWGGDVSWQCRVLRYGDKVEGGDSVEMVCNNQRRRGESLNEILGGRVR